MEASLPVRGAWIEIRRERKAGRIRHSRSPCGERGLKWLRKKRNIALHIVAPRAGSVD